MQRRTFLLWSATVAGVAGSLAIGWCALRKRISPEPLDIQWVCKPLESARSGFEVGAQGFAKWIVNPLIRMFAFDEARGRA